MIVDTDSGGGRSPRLRTSVAQSSQNFHVLVIWCIIGLRHCAELNYGNNVTIAASFIIVIMARSKRVL